MLVTVDQLRRRRGENREEKPEVVTPPVFRLNECEYRNVANVEGILQKQIGELKPGECVNFWSFGSYSLHELMFYILKQTSAAHVNLCTWSISQEAIEQITRRYYEGKILSIRFLLDARVKVCKAKPLQMIAANFPYGVTKVHAKVVTLENPEWRISIVSSQNATTNPKLERGIIVVRDDVFQFDKKIFDYEFERSRVRGSNGNVGIVL